MRLRRVLMLLRRRLYAACAVSLLTPVAASLPAPITASAVNPTPVLTVVSTNTWTETGRIPALHVVGEVLNNDTNHLTAASIQVSCTLFDVSDTPLLPPETGSTDVAILLYNERSPFDVTFLTPPANVDHATCTASAVATTQQPLHFTFQNLAVSTDAGGNYVISGKVDNPATIAVSGAMIYATLYRNNTDSPLQTIGEDQLALNPDGGTLPSGLSDFSITHYAPPAWNGEAYALIGEAPAPAVTLSPASVSLSQVKTRSIDGPPVTLTNSGTAPLHLGALTLTGNHPGDWSEADTCLNQTLDPLGSCSIDVTFNPSDTGDRGALLSISDDGNHNPHALALNGTGTNPDASFAPNPFALGPEVVGTTGPEQTLTVSNPGIGDLHVASAALSGGDAGDFVISNDGCSGQTVAQGSSCEIKARFKPTAVGGRSTSLTLTDDALTSPQSVTVSGIGTTSAVAFDSPNGQYSFGNQQVGVQSASLTVTVTNGGASTLHVSSACLSNTAEFAYASTDFCASGFTLSAGAQQHLLVKMTAAATGLRSTTLTLSDDAPDSPQVATLSGNGTFGGQYHPISPVRLYDSRNGDGPLGAGFAGFPARTIQVTGVTGVGVPSGATAVVLNATVTDTTGASSSFLTIYPADATRPNASNLNWTQGKTIANLAEVRLSAGGAIDLFNALGQVDVVLDVAGYVLPEANPPTPDGFYNPVVPARILDTRGVNGTPVGARIGPVGQRQQIDVQVTGVGGVPASGVAAVVLNVTVTNATASGSFVSVFPSTGTPVTSVPNFSNVNFVAGQTIPNRVVVKVGTGGKVSFYNAAGSVDVIADVGGWFTDASATGTGAGFNPLAPVRILDTRGINGQPVPAGGQIAPVGQTPLKLQVAGATDGNGTVLVPSMSSATPPRAVVINVTVTDTVTDSGGSFLTVWPDGVPEPGISDLNFKAGLTIPNLVVVKVGSDGKIAIANAKGTADVVVDIVGWYS